MASAKQHINALRIAEIDDLISDERVIQKEFELSSEQSKSLTWEQKSLQAAIDTDIAIERSRGKQADLVASQHTADRSEALAGKALHELGKANDQLAFAEFDRQISQRELIAKAQDLILNVSEAETLISQRIEAIEATYQFLPDFSDLPRLGES
jgi:hypothetical protein